MESFAPRASRFRMDATECLESEAAKCDASDDDAKIAEELQDKVEESEQVMESSLAAINTLYMLAKAPVLTDDMVYHANKVLVAIGMENLSVSAYPSVEGILGDIWETIKHGLKHVISLCISLTNLITRDIVLKIEFLIGMFSRQPSDEVIRRVLEYAEKELSKLGDKQDFVKDLGVEAAAGWKFRISRYRVIMVSIATLSPKPANMASVIESINRGKTLSSGHPKGVYEVAGWLSRPTVGALYRYELLTELQARPYVAWKSLRMLCAFYKYSVTGLMLIKSVSEDSVKHKVAGEEEAEYIKNRNVLINTFTQAYANTYGSIVGIINKLRQLRDSE